PPLLLMHRRPEDLGLRPDGEPDPPPDAVPVAGPAAQEREFGLREAVRTRAYWLLGLALTCVLFAGGSINFHQIPHLVDRGLPQTQAALIVTVFSGMGAAGALLGGA